MKAEIKYRKVVDEIETIKRMREGQILNIQQMMHNYEEYRQQLELKNFNYGDLMYMIQYELNRPDEYKKSYTNIEKFFKEHRMLRLMKERRDLKHQPPSVINNHSLLTLLNQQRQEKRDEELGKSEKDPFGIEGQLKELKEGKKEETYSKEDVSLKARAKYLKIDIPPKVVDTITTPIKSPVTTKRKKTKGKRRNRGCQTDVELWGHYNMEKIVPIIMKKLIRAQDRKANEVKSWTKPAKDEPSEMTTFTSELEMSTNKEKLEQDEYRIKRTLELLREFKDDLIDSKEESIKLFSIQDASENVSVDNVQRENAKLKRRVVDLNRVVTRLRMDLSMTKQKAKQVTNAIEHDFLMNESSDVSTSEKSMEDTPQTTQSTEDSFKTKEASISTLSNLGGSFRLPFSSASTVPTPLTPVPKHNSPDYPVSLRKPIGQDRSPREELNLDDQLFSFEHSKIKDRIASKIERHHSLSPPPPPKSVHKKMSIVSLSDSTTAAASHSLQPPKKLKKKVPFPSSTFQPTPYEKLTNLTTPLSQTTTTPTLYHGRLSAKSKSRMSFSLHHRAKDPLRLQWGKEKAYTIG
eukprot:CAMPEP_0117423454 /NCGR_PEP_ID=MMETSP0758-20121206/4065_1 /TAXON_ID=63605 /ORGANISM="Percolomonas cosmopolitus, Strain AE-1 (ATCC 50343)" /LENGTH=576 /DNA_ID=CAMNT_0005206633 /DNA_START=478 /DNA_END=2205 /DNA_ORIENTATION=-